MTATSRSCASGPIATGRAPSEADEPVDEPEALGGGGRRGRQEPGRAVEEVGARPSRASRLGAADRVATDEPRVGTCGRADGLLRRADVGDRGSLRGKLEHAPNDLRQVADGCGDDDEVGPETAAPRSAAASTAPRSSATARSSAFGSQPPTACTPARRAASPSEAPMRPVPMTARRSTVIGLLA